MPKSSSGLLYRVSRPNTFIGQIVLFLVLGLIGFLLGAAREQMLKAPQTAYAMIRVSQSSNGIPLSTARREVLDSLISVKTDQIRYDEKRGLFDPQHDSDRINDRVTVWEIAQESAGLCSIDRDFFDEVGGFDDVQKTILDRLDENGFIELEDQKNTHDAIISWVLVFHARCRLVPDPKLIQTFLESSTHVDEGLRSIHPINGDKPNASTYATAMATWALAETIRANLLPEEQINILRDRHRDYSRSLSDILYQDSVYLRDYPFDAPSFRSWSIGGFVIYVLSLSETPDPRLALFYSRWRAADIEISPDSSLASMQRIVAKNNKVHSDQTRYWDFPWVLMAHVSAYQDASLLEKATLLVTIENMIDEASSENAFERIQGRPWIISEYVIALDYLRENLSYEI